MAVPGSTTVKVRKMVGTPLIFCSPVQTFQSIRTLSFQFISQLLTMAAMNLRSVNGAAAQLCAFCNDLFDSLSGLTHDSYNPWRDSPYHLSISNIENAARNGCEFCRVVLAGFRVEHVQCMAGNLNMKLKARVGFYSSHSLLLVFQCTETTKDYRTNDMSSIYMMPRVLEHLDDLG